MICFSKPLATRDGREVRIYAQDGGGDQPIHGAYKQDERWIPTQWGVEGTFYHDGTPDDLDLVNIKLRYKYTVYHNVYKEISSAFPAGLGKAFSSEQQAKDSRSNGCIGMVKFEVDIEEGQGLDTAVKVVGV